jgi:hypothetical protein
VFVRHPLAVPSVVRLLEQISPGRRDPEVPILLAQGARDEEIPPEVTAQLKMCYSRLAPRSPGAFTHAPATTVSLTPR